MITHEEIKPFKCKECGKPFTTKEGSIKHLNSVHNITLNKNNGL